MRVIAGSARRLLLKTPPGMNTRPTSDKNVSLEPISLRIDSAILVLRSLNLRLLTNFLQSLTDLSVSLLILIPLIRR